MPDKSGRYGLVRWNAAAVFLMASLIEVPFMNTTLYEGPIAKALGGADIAWLVGFVIAAVAYYAWERASGTQPVPALRTPVLLEDRGLGGGPEGIAEP